MDIGESKITAKVDNRKFIEEMSLLGEMIKKMRAESGGDNIPFRVTQPLEPKKIIPRLFEQIGPNSALILIRRSRWKDYDSESDLVGNLWFMPSKPIFQLAQASNQTGNGYTNEEVGAMFSDWYFTRINSYYNYAENLGRIPQEEAFLPLDLALELIKIHVVDKGFDPPWVDQAFSNCLADFGQQILYYKLPQEAPLSLVCRGLYEVFLSLYYPALADPAIQIIEPEKPKARRRRSLNLASLEDGFPFRKKRT